MIDFIKNLNFEKMKPLAIAGVCFVAVFIAGYGTGRASGGGIVSPAKRSLTNYTTNAGGAAKSDNASAKPAATKSTAKSAEPIDPANCYIKGSKSKTFHIPSGAFYERTTPAACFNSEEEATAAGYKKSSR